MSFQSESLVSSLKGYDQLAVQLIIRIAVELGQVNWTFFFIILFLRYTILPESWHSYTISSKINLLQSQFDVKSHVLILIRLLDVILDMNYSNVKTHFKNIKIKTVIVWSKSWIMKNSDKLYATIIDYLTLYRVSRDKQQDLNTFL